MDLNPIIAQIRANVATLSNRVGGAAQFVAAADDQDFPVPSAFVVPGGDEALGSQTAGLVTQALEEQFGVIVAVDNTTDRRGQAAADQLDTIRAELWAALLGWEPLPQYSGCEYRGAVALDMARNRVWYRFDFSSLTIIGA